MVARTRTRRTAVEIEELRAAIYRVCEENKPLTVRQAFYRLVVEGVLEKTQRAYKNVLIPHLGKMRDQGVLPFEWVVDQTRTMRKPRSWNRLADMLESQISLYRRDLWEGQSEAVEVWCESDSAAGVLVSVTRKWDVPLMSARGFSSKTFLWSAAQEIRQRDKPTVIYYFGDHDPSGVHIDANIETALRKYAAEDFDFRREAVTAEQIDTLGLPGSPPKASDSRAGTFEGEAVELEAIPPAGLRRMCTEAIERHIDPAVLEACRTVEREERATLASVVAGMGLDGGI